MPGSGHAVCLAATWIRNGRIKRAGGCESSHVKKVKWHAAIANRTHHIRPIETLPGAGVVAFEEIVKVEWLSVLQTDDSVEAPAVLQFRKTATHLGELIGKVPGEPAADVKTGIATISSRIETVCRLRLVRGEVLAVTGVVHRVRPDKVHI